MTYAEGFVCPLGVQSWCFQSSLAISDWSSWVQAIGSIGAILAAVLVVQWQHVLEMRRTAKAAQHEATSRLRSARDLMALVQKAFAYAAAQLAHQTSAKGYFSGPYEQADLYTLTYAMQTFPVNQIEDGVLLVAFIRARRAAEQAFGEIERVKADVDGTAIRWETTWRRTEEHCAEIERAGQAFQARIDSVSR